MEFFFGQVCENSGKNPSYLQKFACSYTYASPHNILAISTAAGFISLSPADWHAFAQAIVHAKKDGAHIYCVAMKVSHLFTDS